MSGRNLFSAASAKDIIEQRTVGEIDKTRGAVSLFERDLGGRMGRTEFYIDAPTDRDYWPSLHAWPKFEADALVNAARTWLTRNDSRRLLATSCMVDRVNKGVTFVFILHHEAVASEPNEG